MRRTWRSGWASARLRAAATVLAVASVAAVAAAPGTPREPSGQAAGCAGVVFDGTVNVIRPPTFPVAPLGVNAGRRGRLVDLAVDRWGGRRAWVTDGWSIARTDDLGCSWDIVYSLDEAAPGAADPQTSSIVTLATPDVPGVSGVLYALVQDLAVAGGSSRFSLLVTTDDGQSFESRGDGLAPVNLGSDADECGDDRTCDLVGTADASTIYLRFTGPDRTMIGRSTDQGRTFTMRNAATEFASTSPANGIPVGGPTLTDLTTDPSDVSRLWGTSGEGGPHQSQDGGAAFTRYDPFEHFTVPLTDVRHLEMTRLDGAPLVVAVGRNAAGVQQIAASADNGQLFQALPKAADIPGTVTGLAVTDAAAMVVASSEGLFLRTFGSLQATITNRAHPNIRALHAVHSGIGRAFGTGTARETIWGMSRDEILRFDIEVDRSESTSVDIDFGPIGNEFFDPLLLPDLIPGRLTAPERVDLAIDQVLDVPVQLDLPPVPTKVDVFFLVDETGSMQDEFDALAAGIDRIATDLVDAGVDVNVGLGTYGNGFRYHRYRKIGPVDEDFRYRLNSIHAGGDGEVAYTGLWALVTGQALPRSRAGNGARGGQGAEWRDSSVRMIVHVTDEQLSAEPEGPTIQQAYDVLQKSGAKHLGLIAFSEPASFDINRGVQVQDWEPMYELARQTGALAPPGGIDCDGDGLTDVREGDPIVCELTPLTTDQTINSIDIADVVPDLAAVIVNMLADETRSGTIAFNQSASALVKAFGNTGGSRADFSRPVRMQARARTVCTESLAGRQETVRFTATAETRVLAATSLFVTCGDPDVPPTFPVTATAVGAAVAASPAAPPAPIQAPSISQGAVQSQAVAQSNSLVPQAGAAAAQQEQQQYQQASIGKDDEEKFQNQAAFQFSARRQSDPSGVTLAAGVVLAAGAGIVRLRQRRHAHRGAQVRVRR